MLLVWLTLAAGQEQKADAILAQVERALEGITDYTVELQASVNMERLQVPSMTATMYYKAPDRIHFESSSFAMLPREGLALNPANLRKDFRPDFVGRDTVDGEVVDVVRLFPKEEESRRRSMTLWIDPARWVVVQLRTQPFEGRRLMAHFSYQRVENRYWLPDTLAVTFETVSADSEAGMTMPDMAPPGRRQRAPLRAGTITIVYSKYAVNTGLSDEVFEQRKEQP